MFLIRTPACLLRADFDILDARLNTVLHYRTSPVLSC
jgi:hypothetical protein